MARGCGRISPLTSHAAPPPVKIPSRVCGYDGARGVRRSGALALLVSSRTAAQLDKRPESRRSLRGEYIYIFRVAFKVVEQLGATERFWPNVGRPEARCQVVLQTVDRSVCDLVPALEPDVVSLS